MKLTTWLTIVWIVLCLPPGARAQTIDAKAIVEDFIANDAVLELTVPKEYEGVSFFVVWDTEKNYGKTLYGRAGTHSYDLRNHQGWYGRIQALGVTAPNITGRVKIPTLADELDIFLEPERFVPTSVNFLTQHTFLTYSLVEWLFLFMAVPIIWMLARRKRRVSVAVGIAFLLSLSLMELRSFYDDFVVVSNTEEYMKDLHGVFPLVGAETFGDKAAEIIGRATWGHGQVDGIYGSYVRYRLSEASFVPEKSGERPAFWVTRNPSDGTPIYTYSNFHLMRPPQK